MFEVKWEYVTLEAFLRQKLNGAAVARPSTLARIQLRVVKYFEEFADEGSDASTARCLHEFLINDAPRTTGRNGAKVVTHFTVVYGEALVIAFFVALVFIGAIIQFFGIFEVALFEIAPLAPALRLRCVAPI